MPRQAEAPRLRIIGRDTSGRIARLAPSAARAWKALQRSAAEAGIELRLVSTFRSLARQKRIVTTRLRAGGTLRQILRDTAYPGHSEHHTGRAVDIAAPRRPSLTVAFARTPEFAWLSRHAGIFGFHLSYPRGNSRGIAYEPWHWCFRGRSRRDR